MHIWALFGPRCTLRGAWLHARGWWVGGWPKICVSMSVNFWGCSARSTKNRKRVCRDVMACAGTKISLFCVRLCPLASLFRCLIYSCDLGDEIEENDASAVVADDIDTTHYHLMCWTRPFGFVFCCAEHGHHLVRCCRNDDFVAAAAGARCARCATAALAGQPSGLRYGAPWRHLRCRRRRTWRSRKTSKQSEVIKRGLCSLRCGTRQGRLRSCRAPATEQRLPWLPIFASAPLEDVFPVKPPATGTGSTARAARIARQHGIPNAVQLDPPDIDTTRCQEHGSCGPEGVAGAPTCSP